MKAVYWLFAVVILAGCATAETRAPSVDVGGSWSGEMRHTMGGLLGMTMTLKQTGNAVTGDVVVSGIPPLSGPIRGTVAGNELSFSYTTASNGGEVVVKGNEMTGRTRDGHPIVLRRQ